MSKVASRLIRSKNVHRLFALIAIIIVWDLLGRQLPPVLLPRPLPVLQALFRDVADGTIQGATMETLIVLAVGFSIASSVGILMGLLMGGISTFGHAIDVYVHALNSTPRVALIPLVIVWLGFYYEAKVFIVFISSVFPIIVNTYTGVINTDPELLEAARAFGANKRQIFRKVVLPASVPLIMAGLRLGAARAVVGTIVAELFTAITGLGGRLIFYAETFDMPAFFGVVIVLLIVAVSISEALGYMEKRIAAWKRYEIKI